MLVFSQVSLIPEDGKQETFILKGNADKEDFLENPRVKLFLNKNPKQNKIIVFYAIMGYGEGEPFDIDDEELEFFEKLLHKKKESNGVTPKVLKTGEKTIRKEKETYICE